MTEIQMFKTVLVIYKFWILKIVWNLVFRI